MRKINKIIINIYDLLVVEDFVSAILVLGS